MTTDNTPYGYKASLQLSEVLDNYIVSSTVSTLEDAGFIPPSKRTLKNDPVLNVLADAGALDSRTASVLVAELMVRGTDYSTWMPYLDGEVKAVLPLFVGGKDPAQVTEALIKEGSAPALKIAVAAVVNGMTPDHMKMMSSYFGKEDMTRAMALVATPAAALAQAVSSSGIAQEKKLMDQFLASLGHISAHAGHADAKKVDDAATQLRNAIAKPSAKPRNATPTP